MVSDGKSSHPGCYPFWDARQRLGALCQRIPSPQVVAMVSYATVATRKLTGYDFYRNILGSPKYVVAPMVDQSELVCRMMA